MAEGTKPETHFSSDAEIKIVQNVKPQEEQPTYFTPKEAE
jgi:hypothetical protein